MYLLNCAANCIKERHTNVPDLWRSVENDIGFILPHPKGWESAQQQEMRKAAVAARLIPDNPSGHARLAFVSEGEATLYFSIHNGLPSWALKDGHGVVVVEAGRRTINISFYNRNTPEGEKESFDEVADTQCHFYGSEVVTINARKFIGGESWKYVMLPFTDFFPDFLAESPFINELENIVQCFDTDTKLSFRGYEYEYIKFRNDSEATRANDTSGKRSLTKFGQVGLILPNNGKSAKLNRRHVTLFINMRT